MNILVHAATAVPFLLIGDLPGAIGAVFPDLTLLASEVRFRKSGCKSWHRWAASHLTENNVVAYRLVHSLLVMAACAWVNLMLTDWISTFFIGWFIHVMLDLPTHWGLLTPMPLYPFRLRWPYVFKYIKDKHE